MKFPAPIRILLLALLLTLAAGPSLADSGVKGRISWRGELIPGLKVRAYRQIVDIPADKAVAVSEPTGLDGTYTLALPPGQYVLTARSFAGKPKPGDYFCYYSGSPVTVYPDRFTNVGFNLVRIPQEDPPRQAKRSGIEGEITFQGEPLERVYLYVYRSPDDGFKGPGYNILPVEKGHFRLRLPPGDYWLLARKRLKGGRFGPIEIGDYFNYYFGNPVSIREGEIRQINLETITRLEMLERGEGDLPFQGVRGRVVTNDGRPAPRLHVFAYSDPAMTGTPDYFSTPTDADGRFSLPLPVTGVYYLLARESFGGPAADGELYGRYGQEEQGGITIEEGDDVEEVTIRVDHKQAH
ncbi:MAG: hypothetical protein C0616_07315 [Desulfuromonas sp.]|nr:MAG: hypothetical protein C0616_07315 [Desulfuromonas sp.]